MVKAQVEILSFTICYIIDFQLHVTQNCIRQVAHTFGCMRQYVCGQYVRYGFIFHPSVYTMRVAHATKVQLPWRPFEFLIPIIQ